MAVVEVENLKKTYKNTRIISIFPPRRETEYTEALKGITFDVNKGEIFGLLGPNGAGKTTTMLILAGLLLPDSGRAEINGIDVVERTNEVRKIVGLVMGGNPRQMYNKLTGLENLVYFATLYNIPKREAELKARELLKIVGLESKAETLVENYSTGMMQRLAIARGIIHDPEVVLLDEPTLGLDPKAAREIRNFVKKKLKEELGKTIILTTHYMLEAEELADRVAIIDNGKIRAIGRPQELKKMVKEEIVELTLINLYKDPKTLLKDVLGLKGVKAELLDGSIGFWRVKIVSGEADIDRLIGVFSRSNGARLKSLRILEPTLEDVFLKLTSEEVKSV